MSNPWDWHPMSSAPRDGTEIIAWLSSDKFADMTANIYWCDLNQAWRWKTGSIIRRQDLINGWQPYPGPPE